MKLNMRGITADAAAIIGLPLDGARVEAGACRGARRDNANIANIHRGRREAAVGSAAGVRAPIAIALAVAHCLLVVLLLLLLVLSPIPSVEDRGGKGEGVKDCERNDGLRPAHRRDRFRELPLRRLATASINKYSASILASSSSLQGGRAPGAGDDEGEIGHRNLLLLLGAGSSNRKQRHDNGLCVRRLPPKGIARRAQTTARPNRGELGDRRGANNATRVGVDKANYGRGRQQPHRSRFYSVIPNVERRGRRRGLGMGREWGNGEGRSFTIGCCSCIWQRRRRGGRKNVCDRLCGNLLAIHSEHREGATRQGAGVNIGDAEEGHDIVIRLAR